jgi:hypothetical protein
MAYSNVRFERAGPLPAADMRGVVRVADVAFAQLQACDRQMFAADRESFLRAWIAQPDSAALAYVADGAVEGYGVIRRCRRGFKIGPMFATNPDIAENLYLALSRHAGEVEPVCLDVPEVNAAALLFAEKFVMQKVFGTARMYTAEPPRMPLEQVFGVTTFELG